MTIRAIRLISAVMFTIAYLIAPASAEDTKSSDILATQSVIRDQISAFQAKEFDRAFSHAAPSIKKIFKNTDNFVNMVRQGYEPLYNPDSFLFGRSDVQNGTIFQEVLATDGNGKQWQAIYTLKQQEDGSWKITGVTLKPWTGTST